MSRFSATNFGRMGGSPGNRIGPATIGLIALGSVPFLLAWFGLKQLVDWFALAPVLALARPWTLLLYPLADVGNGSAIIGVLFLSYWLYMIGSSLEKEIGTGLLAAATGILTLAGGLAWWLGGSLMMPAAVQMGMMLPAAALTVLWAMRNPEHTIMLMMIIPIKAKWLAVLTAVVVLFISGSGAPLMGVFALLPLLLAFLYATNRIPGLKFGATVADVKSSKKQRQEFDNYMNDVYKREQEREERERLRRLFESSLDDDPNDKR